MYRRSILIAIPLSALLFVGLRTEPAQADLSKKVVAAFKGKLILSQTPIESAGDDKATIAKIKKQSLTTVAGEQNGNDVQEWFFIYTAFLKSAPPSSLKLEFYNDAGDYVADQTLTGVDPKQTVVSGDITINEDDGLTKGKRYTLKVTGTVKGKEIVFSTSSPVTMN